MLIILLFFYELLVHSIETRLSLIYLLYFKLSKEEAILSLHYERPKPVPLS